MKSYKTAFRYINYKDSAGNNRPEPKPEQVYGPIYSIGGLTVCSFLIKTSGGLVLIDDLYEKDSLKITGNIRALGLDPKDIKIILITHWHGDHSGGSAYLATLTGAKVMVHARDADVLETGLYRDKKVVPPVHVSRRLVDGDVITEGDLSIKVLHCPGQSAGSAVFCATVNGPEGPCRAIFAGDGTGFKNSVEVLDRLGYPGVCADYRATVKKLQALDFDLYCGGHPHQVFEEMRPDGNPFVSKEEWLKMVGARNQQMEDFVKEYPKYLEW
jgi:metallo-beta-lactamase class B